MEKKLFAFLEKYMPLEKEEKQAITDLDLFRNYKKGTVILREGHIARENYFVISGCIRTYYIIDGEEKTTAFFTEFESVLTNSIRKDKPAEYNLACVENTVLVVSNPSIEKLTFEKFPRFEKLCRIFSEQLLAKNQASFDSFRTNTPEQRYIELLEKRPDLVQRVPQYQLASYLGIKPESLSRIRKRLQEQVQQVVK
ncbi:MAG: Crp/Fnr family transcriptional regulator [Chitinophagaceae bacterium]|nr:Crp/Fnr family transcriptional regulator [Chitinophagaceae bacterium]